MNCGDLTLLAAVALCACLTFPPVKIAVQMLVFVN